MDVKNKNLVRKNSQKRNHKIYGTTHNATTSDKIKEKQKIELQENMRRILEEVREYIDQGLFVVCIYSQLFVYTLNFPPHSHSYAFELNLFIFQKTYVNLF